MDIFSDTPPTCASHFSNKMKYIDLFTRVSTRLFAKESDDHFLQDVLEDIGNTLQVSRVYIFYSRDKHFWFNAFEWVAKGISAEKDFLQNIDLRTLDKDNMMRILAEGEAIIYNDVESLPAGVQREHLLAQNIKGIVAVPLFYEGAVIGMFGIDQCHTTPNWSENILNTLVALGVFINAAYAHCKGKRHVDKHREQLRTLLDVMPMPIYISNMDDYSFLFCNKAIYDNFDSANLYKEPCHKFLQNLDEPCPFCTNKQLLPDGTPYIWYHHNALLNRDFQVIDSCITWEKKEKSRFSLALDITETLRIQREHVLEQEANEAKGQFIANMSHELRTPLNGIVGLTHLAKQANSDAQIKDYLDKIQFSSDNLLHVINDTLDLSDIDTGKIKFESRLFRLNDVVHGVQAILQLAAETKGIALTIDIDSAVPLMLVGDSLRLSQIMINLTNNAIKFTSEGFVRLAISLHEPPAHHACPVGKKCAWLRIAVQDSGIGIPQDKLDSLFTEFTQVDSSTTRQYGGTGLGLSIVKRFVDLMKGSLSVESTVDQGSTFTCTIPFSLANEFEFIDKQELSLENTKETYDISGVRILVVEDNEINALIACEILESFGCHVEIAENGLAALHILEKNSFDIILMDIQMPILDGLETTRRLRALRHYDTIPIVAMSAHAMTQDFERSLEAGMQDHITKPFIPENLRRIVYSFTKKEFSFSR